MTYGNCNASYTPGSPLVYGNSAPQRPCAPESAAARRPPTPTAEVAYQTHRARIAAPANRSPTAGVYVHMHVHAWPWTGLRAPEKAAQPRQQHAPRGGARPSPGNETGLRRRPGSSSGYWFWNWVKQKKSPVGLRSTCTCTCCGLLASLPATCRLIFAEMRAPVSPSWRRHVKCVYRNGACHRLRS